MLTCHVNLRLHDHSVPAYLCIDTINMLVCVLVHVPPPGKACKMIMFAADLKQLLMGHSTWDTYSSMLKLYKHYDFSLHLPGQLSFCRPNLPAHVIQQPDARICRLQDLSP